MDWESEEEASSESWNRAFDSVPGIIRTKRKEGEKPYLRDLYYIRGILRKRLSYVNERNCIDLLERVVIAGADVESLKELAKQATSWSRFTDVIFEFLDENE